ncbi:MAG: response regulator [Thermoguttaceae bacterium]|jgi:CheY-like chemotaxis protein/MinD-like ATPase involved in chromosome partitioning or flagellar assembly
MHQPKILIVDDDENNRMVLSDALEGEHYTLLEAVNGNDALKVADKEMPDLILLDVLMPGMDGITTLRKLKEQVHTRHIPVIMITVLNLDTQISICLDEGAIDHIPKPFSNMVVRARVRAALRAHSSDSESKLHTESHGKVLGFIGAKGGVGTTTVAVNIALALVKQEHSVILAELNSYPGTVASQLGVDPAINLGPLLECKDPEEINRLMLGKCLTNHKTGLRLLLAPHNMEEPRDIAAEQSENIVQELAGMADFTLVDLPFHPSAATKTALQHCNFVVLLLEPEASCVTGAQSMLNRLQSWGIAGNSVGAVVVKRAPATASINLSQIRSSLNCKVIGVVLPDPDLCVLALNTGSPGVISQPESNFAMTMSELAARLATNQVAALVF